MLSKIRNVKEKVNCRMCYTLINKTISDIPLEKFQSLSHRKRMNLYLNSSECIEDVKPYIPKRYFDQKVRTISDNLYLIDSRLATDIAKHILPAIKDTDQMICETNAGLGLLTSELLDNGLKWVRLYETCPDFRVTLKGFSDAYPGRVELFPKDLFHIWKMSFIDKIDKGNRVAQFLKGVPKRNWSDDPVLTIIGPMPKLDFLSYVFKMISLQNEIAAYGRIELFVIMRPGDYMRLTAGPHRDLHTYQTTSVFSNIFCNFRILEKYPRIAFLPWECTEYLKRPRTHFYRRNEPDKLYLVHIEFKKDIPMESEHLLPFYFFVKQTFRRGSTKIIPQLEKWCSGIGEQIILNEEPWSLEKDIDIFTKTGQLTPMQLLEIFKIFYKHPGFQASSLTAMVEAELLKFETTESDIANLPQPSLL